MQINVKCGCGNVFSFQEEPVNGRLGMPIACTNCGADGTDKANAFIARQLNEGSGLLQPPKSSGGFLGLFRKKEDDVAPRDASQDRVDDNGDETSPVRLTLAGAGALAVGVGGAIGWFYLARTTGYEFGIAAWILGGLVGGASRLIAPRGHYWLGVISVVAAFLAISGGQFLVAKWYTGEEVRSSATAAYEGAKSFAEFAIKAKADDELRSAVADYKLVNAFVKEKPEGPVATYQYYQMADSDLVFSRVVILEDKHPVTFAQREAALDEDKVTVEEIARFKEKTLPSLRELAEGKPSKLDYETTYQKMMESRITTQSLFTQSFGPFTLIWLFLGITTAYKLARNAGLEY